jgi:hypothetical protein
VSHKQSGQVAARAFVRHRVELTLPETVIAPENSHSETRNARWELVPARAKMTPGTGQRNMQQVTVSPYSVRERTPMLAVPHKV